MPAVVNDDEAKINIAENIGRLLNSRQMTQLDLANATGDSAMAISYYVRGKRLPGAAALARLAEALEVTMDELIAAPPRKNSRKRVAS